MSDPVIMIDCDNICYRNWYATSKKLGFDNPVEYGFLRDMNTFAQRLFGTRFVFCFDGDSYLRNVAYPKYKERPESKERNLIRRAILRLRRDILPDIGYKNIFWQPDAEADDLIGYLCKLKAWDTEVIVVSTDQDLYQLLALPYVTVWNPILKLEITRKYVSEQYGVDPKDWVLYKALTGCTSDNIAGVRGVGPILAVKYINGTMLDSSTVRMRIEDSGDLIKLNKSLVTIPYPELTLPDWEVQEDSIHPDNWNRVVAGLKMFNLEGKFPT